MTSTTERPTHPDSVRVGNVVYQVTSDAADWLVIEHQTQTKGYYGHTEHRIPVIYLNPESSPDVMRMTMWHEVLHALCETAMGHPDWRHLGKNTEDREEKVIRLFEAPSLNVLIDNPTLVAYLTS